MSFDTHQQAIVTLLMAGVPTPIQVFKDNVPNLTVPPYVRVFTSTTYPAGQPEDMTHRSIRARCRIVAHSVGQTTDAADVVSNAVRAVLLDVTPTVSGRTCFPIRMESSVDPKPDETTGVLVMDQIDI